MRLTPWRLAKSTIYIDIGHYTSDRLAGILENPPQDEGRDVFNLQEFGLWTSDVMESRRGFSYVGNSGLHHNVAAFAAHQGLPDECKFGKL